VLRKTANNFRKALYGWKKKYKQGETIGVRNRRTTLGPL